MHVRDHARYVRSSANISRAIDPPATFSTIGECVASSNIDIGLSSLIVVEVVDEFDVELDVEVVDDVEFDELDGVGIVVVNLLKKRKRIILLSLRYVLLSTNKVK